MERVARKKKSPLQRLGPSRLDKLQITLLIFTIDLVAHDRMTAVREVNADLVHSPSDGVGLDECKAFLWVQL